MDKESFNPTLFENWIDIVVVVNEKNWIEILLALYSEIDESRIPHFRFSWKKETRGVAIRFLAKEDSDVVAKLISIIANMKAESSINPKKRSDDSLRDLSGWFDGPETFEMTQEWANMLHELSKLAIHAIRKGNQSPEMRAQITHQFCNMMALTEINQQYATLF